MRSTVWLSRFSRRMQPWKAEKGFLQGTRLSWPGQPEERKHIMQTKCQATDYSLNIQQFWFSHWAQILQLSFNECDYAASLECASPHIHQVKWTAKHYLFCCFWNNMLLDNIFLIIFFSSLIFFFEIQANYQFQEKLLSYFTLQGASRLLQTWQLPTKQVDLFVPQQQRHFSKSLTLMKVLEISVGASMWA